MSVKTKIKTISWSVLGLCCLVLLVSAIRSKDSKACATIDIKIEGATQHLFIKKADALDVLNQNNIHTGQTLDDINLKNAEEQLEKNPWIKDAQLFFDNHQTLHVNISEREPIARVFSIGGNSFYIDSTGLRLPANENAAARVIVFTSFPSDKKILSAPDSLVLNDVKTIAKYITADSFLNEQTAQINITQQRTYEITPVVGDQIIRIGNTDSLNEKFTKLIAFYKNVFAKVGFEKYSVIDVQYHDQVVAVRKGEGYTISDTAKAMKSLKQADTKLNTVLNDTTYSAPLGKPVTETRPVSTNSFSNKSASKKQTKKINQSSKKINDSKKRSLAKKPKAVMKKKH
ncbi:MAG TPA: FtsQ-type POTRA domain-containing protein [Parafilimonas sp.]|nr:FtsQ-type POTRA domain-containing protein [Parafilimonas sp.]